MTAVTTRSAMTIDSGIDSVRDLAGILPAAVRDRIDSDMDLLVEPPTAAALRVLATIRDDGWYGFVRPMAIDWPGLLAWARGAYRTTDSVLVRSEVAASLAGYADSQAVLLYAARALDDNNFLAVVDALRIANRGVTR